MSSQPQSNEPYILIVDDDPDARRMMYRTLSMRMPEYEVKTAASTIEGLRHLDTYGDPVLAMVDLYMPGGPDGFSFCHQANGRMPIIMVTAEDDGEVAGKAISDYAHDYMRKPVNGQELVARINRVLRDFTHSKRNLTTPSTAVHLDPLRRTLHISGKVYGLTKKEALIISNLLSNPEGISSQQLIKSCWNDSSDLTDSVLHTAIHRLRKKIEVDHKIPQFIRAIELDGGEPGYRFVCD